MDIANKQGTVYITSFSIAQRPIHAIDTTVPGSIISQISDGGRWKKAKKYVACQICLKGMSDQIFLYVSIFSCMKRTGLESVPLLVLN